MLQPPIDPRADTAAAITKGVVSAIPHVGGLLSELGNLLLNPVEKRKQAWMIQVTEILNTWEQERQSPLASLQADEGFMTFLIQATQAAIRTHQAVKLQALRAALANSLPDSPFDRDVGLLYLRYIDELTPTHLQILAALHDGQEQYQALNTVALVIANIHADIGTDLDENTIRAMLQDLQARFLLHLGDLDDLPDFSSLQNNLVTEDSRARPMALTPQGRRFLSFVRP
jgi:hypothetical protein